jgi:hypothetical protein
MSILKMSHALLILKKHFLLDWKNLIVIEYLHKDNHALLQYSALKD